MSEAFMDGDKITLEKVGDDWKVSLNAAGGGHIVPAKQPIYPTPEEALAAMTETARKIER